MSSRFISFNVYDTNAGSGVFTPARTDTSSVTDGAFAMNFKHGTGTVMEWYADKVRHRGSKNLGMAGAFV